jgi:hypothetical protein
MHLAMTPNQTSSIRHIANALSPRSNTLNVPLVDIKNIDNADFNQCLMKSVDAVGKQTACIHKITR